MKIGLRCHDYGKNTPEDLVVRLQKDGFSAAHLAPYKALSLEGDFLEEQNLMRIKKAFNEADIQIAVLGCYVDPGSLDDNLYQQSMEKFEKHLYAAQFLGANCVGTETSRFEGSEQQYERVLNFSRRMVEVAEKADSIVAIEPVFGHTICSPGMAKRLKDDVNSQRLRFIFDPVNLLCAENTPDQQALWQDAMTCFGEDVVAMHIKDGIYTKNQFVSLPLGQGAAHFENVAQWLKNAHPDMVLIREDASLATLNQDLAYMKDLFGG